MRLNPTNLVCNSRPIGRAVRAYYNACKREGRTAAQSGSTSSVDEIYGTSYVVRRNVNGIIRVYHASALDRLQQMIEWPQGLKK